MALDPSKYIPQIGSPAGSFQVLHDAMSGVSNAIITNRQQSIDKQRADEIARANRAREAQLAADLAAQVAEQKAVRDAAMLKAKNDAATAVVAAYAKHDPALIEEARARYASLGGAISDDQGWLTPPPPPDMSLTPRAGWAQRGYNKLREPPGGAAALKSRGDFLPAEVKKLPAEWLTVPPALRPPEGVAPVTPKSMGSFGMKLRDPREGLAAPVMPHEVETPKPVMKPATTQLVHNGQRLTIDRDEPIRRGVEAIRTMGAGWISQARNADDSASRKRVVEEAVKVFVRAGGDPLKGGVATEQFTEGEAGKDRRARMMAAAKSETTGVGDQFKLNAALKQDINAISMRHGVMKIRETQNKALELKELIANGEGLSDAVAVGTVVRALYGGHASDRDLGTVWDGAGKIESLRREFNKWFASGKMPDDYMSQLETVADLMLQEADWQIHKIGVKAKDAVRVNEILPMTEAQRENAELQAYGSITGIYPEHVEDIAPGTPGVSVSKSENRRVGGPAEPKLQPRVRPEDVGKPEGAGNPAM